MGRGGGGERDMVNSLRPAREGEGWYGDKVNFFVNISMLLDPDPQD